MVQKLWPIAIVCLYFEIVHEVNLDPTHPCTVLSCFPLVFQSGVHQWTEAFVSTQRIKILHKSTLPPLRMLFNALYSFYMTILWVATWWGKTGPVLGAMGSVEKKTTLLSDEMLMKLGLFGTLTGKISTIIKNLAGLGVWGSTLKLFLFSINTVGIPFHKAVINRHLIQGQGGAVFKWN